MKLFELFGTIAIDHSEASEGMDAITEKAGGVASVFEKVGSAAVAVGKVVATGVAAGAAAVGALTKSAVESYAEYEQLVGGVETLFKTSASKVQEYAANAYQTAGLSANEYMETVTGFSASLLQSLASTTSEAYSENVEALDRYYSEVERSADDAVDLLKESQEAEVEAFEKATEAKIALIDKQYQENLKLIDEEKYNQLKAIDEQIDALNAQTEAERAAIKQKEQQDKIAALQEKVLAAETAEAKEKAAKDLSDYLAKVEQEQREKQRKEQIAQLKEQQQAIKDDAQAKKDALKQQYEEEKKLIESQNAEQLKRLKKAQDKELKALKESNKAKIAEAKKYVAEQSAILEASATSLNYTAETYEQAAEYANRAIIDMSDNANKMGTDISMIQNAYQGFAKQNFTMLDNLKLGYGGTKEEMERLLQDAEKLTGIKYDISSFADIVEAIHAIQVEMEISGLTMEEAAEMVAKGLMTEEEAFAAMGTTAKEASTTIQGSVNAMKAAWQNLLIGIADDEADFEKLIDGFVLSVSTAAKNILPRVEIALTGAGKLIDKLFPIIIDKIPAIINDVLPKILDSAVSIVKSLVRGISENQDSIMQTIFDVMMVLIQTITELLPEIFDLGIDLLLSLADGILENLDKLIDSAVAMVEKVIASVTDPNTLEKLLTAAVAIIVALAGGLVEFLPKLVDASISVVRKIVEVLTQDDVLNKLLTAALEIIEELADGLIEFLPELIDATVSVIEKIVEVLTQDENLDKLLEATLAIIQALAEGLVEVLPELITAAADIIIKLIEYLLDQENLGKIAQAAGTLLATLATGLVNSVWRLVEAGQNIGKSFIESILTINWNEVGWKIISGIGDGLKKAWDNFTAGNSWISDMVNGVGSLFSSGGSNSRGGTFGIDGSHADGLDYVPYDGYVAELHKGEMVVPAAESNKLRAGMFGTDTDVLRLLENILIAIQESGNQQLSLTINNREFARAVKGVG